MQGCPAETPHRSTQPDPATSPTGVTSRRRFELVDVAEDLRRHLSVIDFGRALTVTCGSMRTPHTRVALVGVSARCAGRLVPSGGGLRPSTTAPLARPKAAWGENRPQHATVPSGPRSPLTGLCAGFALATTGTSGTTDRCGASCNNLRDPWVGGAPPYPLGVILGAFLGVSSAILSVGTSVERRVR